MQLKEQIQEYVQIILHPGKATSDAKKFDIWSFYFKLALIPFVITLILLISYQYFGIASGGGISNSNSVSTGFTFYMAGGGSFYLVIFADILLFVVYYPVSFFIIAAIYHVLGSVLVKFKQPYKATLAATVYGLVPFIFLFWISLIPLVGSYLLVVLSVWSILVTIIALSNQQRVTRKQAFYVLIPIIIIILIVLVLVFYLIANPTPFSNVHLTPNSSSTKCAILNSNIGCGGQTVTTAGILSLSLNNNLNYGISNVKVLCLLYNTTTLYLNGYSYRQSNLDNYFVTAVSGTISSGNSAQLTGIQCYDGVSGALLSGLTANRTLDGIIVINYTTSTGFNRTAGIFATTITLS
jgi:hypothetical protein